MRNHPLGPLVVLGLIGSGISLPVLADTPAAAPSAVNASLAVDPPDEDLQPSLEGVTVEAHRLKLGKLKLLINKSVDNFYGAFDRANTVPGYVTTCADERRDSSFTVRHVCHPKFEHDANQDVTQGIFDGYATVPAANLIALRTPGYLKQIRQLIHSDPQVRQAALDFDALNQRYAAVNKEKVLPK